jgi:NAD(P)-dependent dehydrogenase (short-subunit alcohol dehydrogenase family)
MKDFDGRTAVVTGAASGIGLALCRAFAGRGMNVVMADVNAERLREAAATVKPQAGREVLPVPTDVTKAESVQALADAAYDTFGAVHVLCNNAGIIIDGPLHEASLADWHWVIDVNLWGVIHGVHAFVPRMVAGGQGGHVVNTASMAGHFSSPNTGVYNVSKFAVVGLTESLSRDLKDSGIGVSCLSPGQVETNLFFGYKDKPAAYASDKPVTFTRRAGANVQPPEKVAEIVIAGIEEGRMHIFPHPDESRKIIEVRSARMLRDAVPV